MMTDTNQLMLCDTCNCATKVLMDDDGNRYCGKCKQKVEDKNERTDYQSY